MDTPENIESKIPTSVEKKNFLDTLRQHKLATALVSIFSLLLLIFLLAINTKDQASANAKEELAKYLNDKYKESFDTIDYITYSNEGSADSWEKILVVNPANDKSVVFDATKTSEGITDSYRLSRWSKELTGRLRAQVEGLFNSETVVKIYPTADRTSSLPKDFSFYDNNVTTVYLVGVKTLGSINFSDYRESVFKLYQLARSNGGQFDISVQFVSSLDNLTNDVEYRNVNSRYNRSTNGVNARINVGSLENITTAKDLDKYFVSN